MTFGLENSGKLIDDNSLELLLTTYPETRSSGYGL